MCARWQSPQDELAKSIQQEIRTDEYIISRSIMLCAMSSWSPVPPLKFSALIALLERAPSTLQRWNRRALVS